MDNLLPFLSQYSHPQVVMYSHFLLLIFSALAQIVFCGPLLDGITSRDDDHDPCEFIALDNCPSLWADDFLSINIYEPVLDFPPVAEFSFPSCDVETLEGCFPLTSDEPVNFGLEDFLTGDTIVPDLGPNDCKAPGNPYSCPFSQSFPEYTYECTQDRTSCLICTRNSDRPCYTRFLDCAGDAVDLTQGSKTIKNCYFCREDGGSCHIIGDVEKLPSPYNPYGQEWNTCPNKICL